MSASTGRVLFPIVNLKRLYQRIYSREPSAHRRCFVGQCRFCELVGTRIAIKHPGLRSRVGVFSPTWRTRMKCKRTVSLYPFLNCDLRLLPTIPVHAFHSFSRQGSALPSSSTIELPSNIVKSGIYSSDIQSTSYSTFAKAKTHNQAFSHSVTYIHIHQPTRATK